MKKRLVAILLCMAMIVGLFPAMSMTAFSADEKIYINEENFPDANFRNALLTAWNPSARDPDWYEQGVGWFIYKETAESIETIDVSAKNISSLKGIEYFTGLKILECHDNKLTELDVTKNTQLKTLTCSYNALTSLDLSKNTALENLSCSYNSLATLDLRFNLNLTRIVCDPQFISADCYSRDDGLYRMHMSGVVGSENLSNVTFLAPDVYDPTTDTLYIPVSPESAWTNYDYNIGAANQQDMRMRVVVNLVSYDDEKIYLNETNFPDAAFRDYLRESPQLGPWLFVDELGVYIYESDAERIEELSAVGMAISDLTGIEFFTGLTSLNCASNQLTELDLGKNTALEYLNCSYNQLEELDLSNNTKLTELLCASNRLTALDLSQNTALEQLYCNNNFLTKLDLSNNLALEYLFCGANSLATLDLEHYPSTFSFDYLEYEDQKVYAQCVEKNGVYELDMKQIVGSDKLSRFNFVSDVTYDRETGIATFDTLPESVNYKYSTGYNNKLMEVMILLEGVSGENPPEDDPPADEKIYINEYNFPDANFRAYLTDELLADVLKEDALGAYVLKSVAEAVEEIYIFNKGISDLTGIEWFTGLKSLTCASNQLTELDLSANTKLETLTCDFNPLTALDVSKNTALLSLSCYNTELTALDLSKNTALVELNCYSNCLATLDLSANTALTSVSCSRQEITAEYVKNGDVYVLDMNKVVGSENLSKVTFDASVSYDASTGIVTFTELPTTVTYDYAVGYEDVQMDVTATLSEATGDTPPVEEEKIYINEVNFPDANFRTYLLGELLTSVLKVDSRAGEFYVLRSDAEAIEKIDVSNKNISNLKGIGFFTNLTFLKCSDNKLEALDVSKNTKLQALYCYGNQLTALDLSSNPDLTCLDCAENRLTALDVSSLAKLAELYCNVNELTELNLNSNPELRTLDCSENQLTTLNVNYNTKLEDLYCHYNWLFMLNVSKNTKLSSLDCAENLLTELDVSKNTELNYLDCGANQLKKLDVSKNTKLTSLWCYSNKLPSLNLSENTLLEDLNCAAQEISAELSVVNGKYELDMNGIVEDPAKVVFAPSIDYVASAGIATFAEKPDIVPYYYNVSNSGWEMSVSIKVEEKIYINSINFPDENFRSAMLTILLNHNVLKLDSRFNEYIYRSDAESILEISVAGKGISNLKGIEYFTNLVALNCSSNQLTALDLSSNNALERLYCGYNQLTALDVGTMFMLKRLSCEGNQLTALDVTMNTALVRLECDDNQLTALDVRMNPALEYLACGYGLLTALDVSKNTKLTYLNCNGSALEALDVSSNINLEYLFCADNELETLDLSSNIALKELDCGGNSLTKLTLLDNTELTRLICPWNQLTELDVSSNTALVELYCGNNKLRSLDLSENAALESLDCSWNQLTTLDLSQNTWLTDVFCYSQTVSAECRAYDGTYELDMRALVGTANIHNVSFDAPDSTVSYNKESGIATLTTLPESVTYSYDIQYNGQQMPVLVTLTATYEEERLYINEQNFPDELFRHYLEYDLLSILGILNYDGNNDPYILKSDAALVVEINVAMMDIGSLQGIEFFTELTELSCEANQLTALDLSKNTKLETLNCSNNQLTTLDLTANTALLYLYSSENQLTSLDVSRCYDLIELDCSYNQLAYLDVSNLTRGLYKLNCSHNLLTELDLLNNAMLSELNCSYNQLTSLDVSNNEYLSSLDCSYNHLAALDLNNRWLNTLFCNGQTISAECLWMNRKYVLPMAPFVGTDYSRVTFDSSVDFDSNTGTVSFSKLPDSVVYDYDVYCGGVLMDVTVTLSGPSEEEKIYINKINFPDDNFRAYLTDKLLTSMLHTEEEVPYIFKSEAETVLNINIQNMGISNLKGIEYFTKLTWLDCSNNQLASLDVSKHTALEYLNCMYNQLLALDVSKNTVLNYLSCDDNQLQLLDVGNNTALEYLSCAFNQLTALDVTQNTLLNSLACNNNKLTSLDLSGNEALTYLECSSNQLTELDLSSNLVLDMLYCGSNYLTALDLSNNEALWLVDCSGNRLTALDLSNNSALEELYCSSNRLTELDLSSNTGLCYLNCDSNELSELDLSNNAFLGDLSCSDNQLTELDLSSNADLVVLDCSDNELTELDLSSNTDLLNLNCSGNHLATLDLSSNTSLTNITCYGQTISAECAKKNGTYEVDMNSIVGSANLSNVAIDPTISYDAATGIVSFTAEPTDFAYHYSVGNGAAQMDVTVSLTIVCGHSYEAVVTAPTCTEDGYTTYTCSLCGDSYVADEVEATGHVDTETVTIEATCTDAGSVTVTCACGEVISTEIIDALGHDMITDPAVAATCTAAGKTEGSHCSRCDYAVAQQNVPALGHDMIIDPAVAATCTTAGKTEGSHCSRCDHKVAQEAIPALGHDWDDGIVTIEPTTTTEGEKTYTCHRCDATKIEVIPMLKETIPVDTDNNEIADTDVEAEPGEGLTYVDEEGNTYIPIDSNVEDGNMDGETDFYVEVTENDDGDYPYTDNFGNDYIPVDVDGNGEPDVFVKVVGDEDNDGKPEDEAGNEYEGVDGDGDGDPDYWQPVEEETGFTASLAAPNEKYGAAADYFAAAGITIDGLVDGESYVAGHTFYISSEIACVVAISFDGGLTYSELVATAAEAENTYYFTLPELTGDFVIGIALKGDANGDATVDVADATRIQRYFTFDPDEPYNDNYEIYGLALLAADANSDDMVDVADATRIQRYFTFDPDEPYDDNYKLLWNVS